VVQERAWLLDVSIENSCFVYMLLQEHNWIDNDKFMGSIMNFVNSECSERHILLCKKEI
jgi:hypothetical protein